jgi:hypothetical protein
MPRSPSCGSYGLTALGQTTSQTRWAYRGSLSVSLRAVRACLSALVCVRAVTVGQKTPAPVSAPQKDPYADVDGIDGEILRTRGRYAQLAAVALFNGLTMREVTCRWHKLRDGKEIYA